MHPLSDKDLDRLSREAADQYDVEQSTSGWDKLEQKLNKQLPQKGRDDRRRFLFFIWIFAVLTGGGLLWMLTSNQSSTFIALKKGTAPIGHQKESQPGGTPVASKKDDKPIGTASTAPLGSKQIPNTPGPGSGSNATEDTETSKPGKSEGSNHEGPDNQVSILSPASTSRLPVGNGPGLQLNKSRSVRKGNENKLRLQPSTGTQVDKLADNRQPSDNRASFNDQRDGEKQNGNNEAVPNENNEGVAKQTPKVVAGIAGINASDSAAKQTSKADQTTVDSTATVKKISSARSKDGFPRGFEFGVLGAPDMSNVKFSNADKPGFNVGLQLGYRFSSRWSVNTGVIYTKKNYTSAGKDFNPPKGTWLDNVLLDEVEGNCFMFDIPVNVRYDLAKGTKNRFFLGTGLSTYLMNKEQYHYYYAYTNGSPGYRYRSLSSSEKHWFSILNLSAGYEKKVSKRFSVQAEPYLKVPLTGIGYGNLSLSSYGMYFLVKYR